MKLVDTLDVCVGRSTTPRLNQFQCYPCFSPYDYHDFIDSKIAGVRTATVMASPPMYHPHVPSPDLATFTTVSVDDVIRAVRMSPSKICPSDPLPTWHLKECAFNVAPFVTRILNLSLTGGDFPSPWKHAIVTPVLKKAGLNDTIVSSYRLVSNLPHLSKILERIVHRQVISHLKEFKLLPNFQSIVVAIQLRWLSSRSTQILSMPSQMENSFCCLY